MKRLYILLIACTISGSAFAQQLPFHSQYMYNKFYINPAVAGSENYSPALLSFRSQWTGFDKDNSAPVTQTLSFHTSPWENMGVGGLIFNDRTGPITRTGLQAAYAYHIPVMEDASLSLSVAGLLYQHVLNMDQLTLDDPNDLAVQGGKQKALVPDAIFGAYYYAKNYYIGFSVPQLFQNKIKINENVGDEANQVVRHYFLTGGYEFEINEDFDVEPSLLFKAIETAPAQLDINGKVTYQDMISLGASYRHKESIVAMLGFEKNDFTAGYSFDITLTNIRSYTAGSHEIFVGYNFQSLNKKGSRARMR